jgi:signal transduction histidine kinase
VFHSLTFKLAAVLLVILIVAGAAQTFRLLATFGAQWAGRQEDIGAAVLERALERDGATGLAQGKLPRIDEEARSGRAALRLYEPDGKLLDWIGRLDGQPDIGPAQLQVVRGLGPNRPRRLIPFYDGLALGLRVDTGPSGPERYLVYSVSREPEPWIGALNRVALRNLVFSTVLAALVGLSLVRWLVRRLKALAHAFQKVASGDLTTRVPEPRERELAELARSFNRMAAELERAQAERRHAEEERRSFMAQASHELRTPLTAIQGYLETLTMEGLDLDEAKRHGYLDRAFLEAQELGHRVEDLVELVRLERPSFRLSPAEAPLAALFEELERRYQPLAGSAGVELRGLGQAPAVLVRWDRRRVVQAIGNLLHNALKASKRGGSVTVEAAVGEGHVRIAVVDSGPGLEGYDDPSGLGLGLKIARQLLERHGGSLRLEAAAPQGLKAIADLPDGTEPAASLASDPSGREERERTQETEAEEVKE